MENKESKSDKNFDILKIAISVVTISTPFIYIVGLNFYAGVLSGYGVSSSFFPLSIEDILVNAYYFFVLSLIDMDSVLKILLTLITISVITVVMGAAMLFIELSLKKIYVLIKDKYKVGDYDRKKEFNRLKDDALINNEFIVLYLLIVLLIALPSIAADSGKDFSIKLIEDFHLNKCTPRKAETGWNRCITVINNRNDEVIVKGLLIANSQDRVAIYSDNRSRILNYSENYDLFYEYKNKEEIKNN